MLKRVTVYVNSKNSHCREVIEFLSGSGVDISVRDVTSTPLSAEQVKQLIGHLNPVHFLNSEHKAYGKLNLDTKPIDRSALYQEIAGSNDLLQFPIITTNRLATVGFNADCLRQMLQLSNNGTDVTEH